MCRGLTRATYILCIEHPRPKHLSQESNPGPPAMQANTLCKEPFELLTAIRNLGLYYYSSPPSRNVGSTWLGIVAEFDSDADISDQTRGGPNSTRGSKALESLLRAREQGVRTSEPRENCITSGSCRVLTRTTYNLCIEHPRPKRLSQESNPGPPALQANTLCKELFERCYWMLFGTSRCTSTHEHKLSFLREKELLHSVNLFSMTIPPQKFIL
jgi:hypothetical protein